MQGHATLSPPALGRLEATIVLVFATLHLLVTSPKIMREGGRKCWRSAAGGIFSHSVHGGGRSSVPLCSSSTGLLANVTRISF
jgi:hypothetical protein